MGYSNFLSGQLSPRGTVGKKAWDWGKSQGYSDQQLKVAVQQLVQNAGVGVNNAPGQFFNNGGPMRGVPGIASPKNPLGKYQGTGGNFGLKSYNAAKADGWTAAEIGSNIGSSGMFMPSGSMNQYQQDMADQHAQEQLQMQAQYQADMEKWKAEYQAAQVPTIQRSGNPGAVGKPAAGMKIAEGDDYSGGRRGSGDLNRDSAYFMNNLGGLGSATAAVSSLNIG
tara:strand:+ start:44 stop:715 length:672 start_codon:yes stop_codon:yes gene_type:complete